MKYYYTDPLAAAWMADKFGMKFEHDFDFAAMIIQYDLMRRNGKEVRNIYIHPESLYLLRPQEGDVIDSPIGIVKIKPREHQMTMVRSDMTMTQNTRYTDIETANAMNSKWGIKIIQRAAAPFMWPEIENE
jgi:hypothetical protein